MPQAGQSSAGGCHGLEEVEHLENPCSTVDDRFRPITHRFRTFGLLLHVTVGSWQLAGVLHCHMLSYKPKDTSRPVCTQHMSKA